MEQTRTALKNEKKLARIVNETYRDLMHLSEDSRPSKVFLKNAEQAELARAMCLKRRLSARGFDWKSF